MFDAFCLGVVLAVGQSPMEPSLALPPELPRNVTVPNVAKESPLTVPMMMPASAPVRTAQGTVTVKTMPVSAEVPGKAVVGDGAPTRIPASLPTMTVPNAQRGVQGTPVMQTTPAAPAPAAPAAAPAANGTCATCEAAKEEAPAEEPEKGHFMKHVEGTHLGAFLEAKKITVSGWIAGSATHTNADTKSTLPLTWNDRNNTFLLQQFWAEFARNIDTDSKECDWGWKVAFLAGSDYRFTVNRGMFDNQLRNNKPDAGEPFGFEQNIYGYDIPIAYINFWLPDMFEGTEVQVGKIFTPFGYESVMAPVSPLMSRSYAFNFAPPFFHTGISVNPKFSDTLSGKFAIVNGNDVFFDGSDEIRFVGTLTKTFNDGDDAVTVGTSVGKGKFRPASALPQNTTLGLASEGFGRNNINVFDLVWTHKVNDDMSLGFEAIYGYQTGVPAGATGSAANFGGGVGTAQWASIVNYLSYKLSDKVGSVVRLENFYDEHGQRTGFEGLYTAVTAGLQIQLSDSIMLRPEVRYDYNSSSTPFGQAAYRPGGNSRDLFSTGADLIIKW